MMRAASIAVKPIGHIRVTRVLRLRRDLASDGGLGSVEPPRRGSALQSVHAFRSLVAARWLAVQCLSFLRDRAFQAVIGRYTCPSGGAASGSGPGYASGRRV